MSISSEWGNDEKTVLITTIVAPWNWQDFEESNKRTARMIDEVVHQVDIIMNLTHAGQAPSNAIGKFRQAASNQHPRVNKLVMVGMDLLGRTIASTVSRVSARVTGKPVHIHFVSTMDEAYALLSK